MEFLTAIGTMTFIFFVSRYALNVFAEFNDSIAPKEGDGLYDKEKSVRSDGL